MKNTQQTLHSLITHVSCMFCFKVLGASGDLAKKKTFPALYALYCYDLLPNTVKIIGYARSELSKVKE